MAAYGALVSVMQIMDQIDRHPCPPISLRKEQVESLTANVTFLQEFLEGYNPCVGYSEKADLLESRIAEAAYAAEDVIESYIVAKIHARWCKTSFSELCQGLQEVIEEMDLIKMEIKEKIMKEKKDTGVQILKKSTVDAGSSGSSSTAQKVPIIVGFDEVLYYMLDKITGGGVDRQIIPIVGMGGLGKTTLARIIYANPHINEYFDVCAWSTISHKHNTRKILSEILDKVDKGNWRDLSEYEIGERLYKYLIGRRYLIVMDDIWSIEAWDSVRRFFPNDGNRSRIVITTRLSNLASKLNSYNSLEMKSLDEATSWNLFSKIVFGEKKTCPHELADIGKKIVEGCKGLPLSIVVIGGLLSKSEQTREKWKSVERKLNSTVNLEDDQRCLQILYTSYNNLPVHIKPCFLYMGFFGEDSKIRVLNLIHLWVAEGFLKPIHGKSLEDAGEEYLEELVDRNLLVVEKRNHRGKVKSCEIHDLLRDLCLREGRKWKFVYLLEAQSIPRDMSSHRRIASTLSGVNRPLTSRYLSLNPSSTRYLSLNPASTVRSLIGSYQDTVSISNLELLRICLFQPVYVKTEQYRHTPEYSTEYYNNICRRLVNLRHLLVSVVWRHPLPKIPSSVYLLWNLQKLSLANMSSDCVLEIWRMPLLRHVMTYHGTLDAAYCLPPFNKGEVVLQNLQTLFVVRNLKFVDRVLAMIPNIKKMKLKYYKEDGKYLNNLHWPHTLENLHLSCSWDFHLMLPELTLPYSLIKLVLKETKLPWEVMSTTIGCLPLLRVLQLKRNSFTGSEWETVEGQFSSLKFLLIEKCDLVCWITDNTHFPRLEHLHLSGVSSLVEIPLSIGDIPTLRSIMLGDCSDYVLESARKIVKEQEDLGNEDIQLQVLKVLMR